MDLKAKIRNIPDFPKCGILFRDITTLLKDKDAFSYAIEEMAKRSSEEEVDVVVAVESRGFIFGAPLSLRFRAGFVPVRKKGKLPGHTISEEYELEYGVDNLEIHQDAISTGQKVLIVDDLLATGGTISAVSKMVEKLKGKIVGIVFLVELLDLKGREKLSAYKVSSLVQY